MTSKRIFGYAVFHGEAGLPEELLNFCATNGWEIELSVPSAYFMGYMDGTSDTDVYVGIIQNIINRGIPVWLEIEVPIYYYGGVNVNTTPEQYQTMYGAGLAKYEALGPLFKGYCFEGGYDNAIIWLKQHSKKKLLGHWLTGYYLAYNSNWAPSNVAEWGTHDMAWRVNQLDEIDMEIYQIEWCQAIPHFKAWLDTVAPNKPFGVLTGLEINGGYWWNMYGHAPYSGAVLYTYEQEKALLTQWCNWLKAQIGAFSGIVFDPGTQDAAQTISELTYIDSLNLLKDGGEKVYTYNWNFGDSATSTEASPSHTYSLPGVYNIKLDVSDGTSVGSGAVSITVVKQSVVVTLTADKTQPKVGEAVKFTATIL